MCEYVKKCKSSEESANGNSIKCLFNTCKYSETINFNSFDFVFVKSLLFKTIHFLKVSLKEYIFCIFKYFSQFLYWLKPVVSL